MVNQVKLRGCIKDIQPSHKIGDIEYDKANIVVQRADGKDDVISLKFKKYSNLYSENDIVSITGNLRSYSQKINDTKSKVDVYVFTYFDLPEDIESSNNDVVIDGRICKIEEIRVNSKGHKNIHITVANNLELENGKKLNSYIPCVAWDAIATKLSKLKVNDKIIIYGELHSREYKKSVSEDEYEIRVAHELLIKGYDIVDEI